MCVRRHERLTPPYSPDAAQKCDHVAQLIGVAEVESMRRERRHFDGRHFVVGRDAGAPKAKAEDRDCVGLDRGFHGFRWLWLRALERESASDDI